MSYYIPKYLFPFILLLCLEADTLSAQELIETVYLEKDDGLASRVINHVARDSKGYFYLFGDNNIQQYDGEKFRKVDLGIIVQKKLKVANVTAVIAENNLIHLISDKNNFVIEAGSLSVSGATSTPSKHDGIIGSSPSNTSYGQDKLVRIDDKEYLWTSKYLYKNTKVGRILIDSIPHQQEELKFVSFDKCGNTIAVYSSSQHTMNHIYVLDTLDRLHDYSFILNEYSTIKDIHADDAFHKWLVVGYNGIKIFTFKREGVTFLEKQPGIAKGQFGRIITGISTYRDKVLFNSESRRYFLYDPVTKKYSELFENFGFISEELGSVRFNNESGLCVQVGRNSSDISDIYILDPFNDRVDQHTVPYDYIDFVFHSSNLIYLVGKDVNTDKGVLSSYDVKTKVYKKLISDIPDIKSIHYSETQKQYWLATTAGLYGYDKDLKPLAKFDSEQSSEKLLLHDDINMVDSFIDKLVVCTNGGGVYIIDPISLSVTKNITDNEGLTNNIAVALEVDNNNFCWIGTYNGLNVIDQNFEIVKKIYDFNGLPNREFNSLAVDKDKSGRLYFGTINGLCIIEPEKVLEWEDSYQLAIDEVNAGGMKISLEDHNNKIYDSADSLVISYSITDYYNYPYAIPTILTETNQDNTIRTFKNRISISQLSKGPLDLSLTAGHNDVENYRIEIQKDYSSIIKMASFIIGTILLGGLILWSVISYIKRKEKEKTELNKKLNELKLTSLQAQMNPHFIFNALGSIQYFIQTSNIKQADAYLSDFAVLMRGILESSKRKMISLREEIKLLKLYIGLEKTRFEDKFVVEFIIHKDTDLDNMIPPMILQPYIENAINHGLHHLKERKGKLEIQFFPDEQNFLNVKIIDNGIGRSAAAEKRINKSHKSRGMDNISERVNVINSSRISNIKITIKDIFRDRQPYGTEVQLTFKD